MPIQFDKYDQLKIDRLRSHLELLAKRGIPKHYEIFVDGLKAVQKTNDPSEFDAYETYMMEDTAQIRIVMYHSGASPRNDQYVFSLKAKSSQEALDISLDGYSLRKLSKAELGELKIEREHHIAESQEVQRLNEELEKAKAALEKQKEDTRGWEEAARKEREKLELLKADREAKSVETIGEIIQLATNGKSLFSKLNIPLGGASDEPQNQANDTPATFSKKSEGDKNAEFENLKAMFMQLFLDTVSDMNGEEMVQYGVVLDRFRQDKTLIPRTEKFLANGEKESES